MDSAKIESGKQELNPTDMELMRFLRAIVQVVGVKTEAKGLELICDFAPDLPDVIRADERRLRQVLLNLLANAVKFTDRGQVGLHVRFLPPTGVRFEVRDTGIGIAQQDVTAIFQPFTQVGDPRHRAGGTGLGLLISRQFVRLMGGDIEVESRVGQGSAFTFALQVPVVRRHGPPMEAPPARTITGYVGARRRVLVVDDIAENRAVLRDMLGPLGFEICEAANGREALERALSQRPDLVLMDVFMPEMDGLNAIARLRQMPGFAELPVITVSASASGRDEEACLIAGANAFLPKPVDARRLLEQLGRLLPLDWIGDSCAPGDAPPTVSAVQFIVPPRKEMEALHRMALEGSMRDVARMAAQLTGLDERYRPFSNQLLALADRFQSKAILRFVEAHMDGAVQQPGPYS